jgi:hypothetical protein
VEETREAVKNYDSVATGEDDRTVKRWIKQLRAKLNEVPKHNLRETDQLSEQLADLKKDAESKKDAREKGSRV